MRKLIIYSLLLLSISACKKSNGEKINTDLAADSTAVSAVYPFEVVDKDVEILATTYLVNVDSPGQDNKTSVMSAPDQNSTQLDEYYLGRKLSVVSYADDWLGILDSIDHDASGNKLDAKVYRKVYIKKNTTGSLSKFHLKKNEFSVISIEDYDGDGGGYRKVSADTLEFEVISREVYEAQKKNTKAFLLQDTLSIRKKGNVLKLPCKNQTVELKDVNSDDDSYSLYKYIGQIEDLNVYVVSGNFYEGFSYFFYDKTTGEQVASFEDGFAISPDKKYIADIWGNAYDQTADFNLYKIGGANKISNILTCSFSKWQPFGYEYVNSMNYFFGADNYLYVRTVSMALSGWADGSMDDYAQYIRIKLKI